jgi:hypothetical protein
VGLTVAAAFLAGCAYVTRDDYLKLWDEDGDKWPLGDDCAPKDELIYPYAPDLRGDGCDTDCGTEPDADGDDWPDKADCAPDDPEVFPCAPDDAAPPDTDCDGTDGPRADACDGADPDYEDPEYAPCEEGGSS